MTARVLNIAHRGGAGLAPENSLQAFRNAVSLGVDGVELDVHLWQGNLVVVHDDPSGPVSPTLREVLEILRPSSCLLFAECKSVPRSYPGITESMIETIGEFGMIDRCIFASFDHDTVVGAKNLNSSLRTAALSSIPLHDPGSYVRKIGADIYAPSVEAIGLRALDRRIRRETFQSCRHASVPVWVYTVNESPDMEKVIQAGAEAILTDYPDRLQTLLQA